MKSRIVPISIFAFGILLHGIVIPALLPEIPLVKYWHAADLLLKGQLQGERLLDFSPSYLYLNVFVQWIRGSLSWLLWLQIFCTSLSACLLFLLLRRFFPLFLAILGAIAFLLDGGLIIFTQTFEPEAILIVCSIASTYFLLQKTFKGALFAGIFFGLALVTRPNFLPVLFVVPFYFLWNSKDRNWTKQTALFLLPVMFCLVTIWIRNQSVLGKFTPVVMNPGTVFYEGNNPNSRGMSSIYPPVLNQLSENYSGLPDYHHQLYRDFAREITGENLSIFQVNSFWTNKAVKYLSENPAHTARLAATKVLHIFHDYRWHDLSSSYQSDQILQQSWIPGTPFALISALAILGLLFLAPQWKQYVVFYAFFFTQFLVMLFIYVSARQKVSVLFVFIFFACAALQFLFAEKKRLLLFTLLLPFALVLHHKTDWMKEEDHLWNHTLIANRQISEAYRLRNEGKIQAAAMKSASALALTPWRLDSRRPANIRFQKSYIEAAIELSKADDPASLMDRAVLLLENGQSREAFTILQQLYSSGYQLKRDDQQSSNYNFYLARCAWLQGKRNDALQFLTKGREESPGDPWILSHLTAITGNNQFRSELYRYFDEIDGAYFLGKAYFETNQASEAAKYFKYLVIILPQFRKAYIDLAAALGQAGKFEEAAIYYRKAIQLKPDPVFHERELVHVFQQLSERQNTSFARYAYGVVLRQFGHFEEALHEQEKALSQDPQNQEFLREIATLKKIIQLNPSTNGDSGE